MKNYIQMVGTIWMPYTTAAMDKPLDTFNIQSIESISRELFDSESITREAIEYWLSLNSGDFRGIDDFYASINGEEFPWENEESELTYFDCMHGYEE